MRRLLAFEFRKLIRCKALYICLVVMVALSVIGVVITKSTMNFMGGISELYEMEGLEDFGILSYSGLKYLVSACNGSNMLIFFAIYVTIFVCADFTEGTIKNIVARGYSREQVFFAKSIVICTGSIVFCILAMLTGFLGGTVAFRVGKGFTGGVVVTLLIQLLAMIAYTMLNVLLAVLFGKLGGALTLGIVIPLVYPLIIQLLDLCIVLLFGDKQEVRSDFLSRFTIGTNLGNISVLDAANDQLVIAAVIFVVYIILFTLLGILSIRRKEV